MNSSLVQLKQELMSQCVDLEFPQSQQVLNFIKNITGTVMMEQDRPFHIQYQHGV